MNLQHVRTLCIYPSIELDINEVAAENYMGRHGAQREYLESSIPSRPIRSNANPVPGYAGIVTLGKCLSET